MNLSSVNTSAPNINHFFTNDPLCVVAVDKSHGLPDHYQSYLHPIYSSIVNAINSGVVCYKRIKFLVIITEQILRLMLRIFPNMCLTIIYGEVPEVNRTLYPTLSQFAQGLRLCLYPGLYCKC